MAKTVGTLSLALRKFNDPSLSSVSSINAEGLSNGQSSTGAEEVNSETSPPAAVPVVQKDQPKPAPVTVTKDPTKFSNHVLEIHNGDKVERVEYRREVEPRGPGAEVRPGDAPAQATPPAKKTESPAEGN